MELWEEVRQQQQGEVIGTTADIGDVVRIQNDVMVPAYMTDEARETMIGLLARGIGEPMGEEEISFDTTYYTIFSSGQSTADGYVTLTDTGRFYMDGVHYELSTAGAVQGILEAQYKPRITADGYDVTEMSGVVGEFLYIELCGLEPDAQLSWSTEDEDVCTVTGDAYGAEIYVTGVGETVVSAVWQSDGVTKSDSVTIYGQKP